MQSVFAVVFEGVYITVSRIVFTDAAALFIADHLILDQIKVFWCNALDLIDGYEYYQGENDEGYGDRYYRDGYILEFIPKKEIHDRKYPKGIPHL